MFWRQSLEWALSSGGGWKGHTGNEVGTVNTHVVQSLPPCKLDWVFCCALHFHAAHQLIFLVQLEL